MARHRTFSIELYRYVAQDFLSGETFYELAKRHDGESLGRSHSLRAGAYRDRIGKSRSQGATPPPRTGWDRTRRISLPP